MDASASHARFVEAAFWMVLERAPGPLELRDQLRAFDDTTHHWLPIRLLSSPEGQIALARRRDEALDAERPELETAFTGLGSHEWFVERAYEVIFGRPADPGGLAHYAGVLASGQRRTTVVRTLTQSDEFVNHFREVAPQAGVVLEDTQLCELANPAKWDNREWLEILRSLGQRDDKLSMHRKAYEFTQLAYGCQRLGVLHRGAAYLSVGAGHEAVLYWLASRVGQVIGVDRYDGLWSAVQSREGDAGVIHRPEDYAPFPYDRERLRLLQMDARQLGFADATFDVAYSLSSVEHFGGVPGARAAVLEMARVLKPGGILALATDHVLEGPPHEETFTAGEFVQLVTHSSLQLVAPVDMEVYRRYSFAAVDLYRNPYQTPHMVVRFGDTVFTTVMVFLRKV